jgi:biotin transporter BioY
MNRNQIFKISKYVLNLIVLGFLWLLISANFTFYKFSIDWSRMKILSNIIGQFLPFLIMVLVIITLINFCVEKYLEKENRKEFLRILMVHSIISLLLILYYSYQFCETDIY